MRSLIHFALVALLLAGCAAADSADMPATAEQPEPECDIDPNVAAAAQEAIQLWSDAAGTPIPLPTRIELADFGADQTHDAAWNPKFDLIQVSTLTQPAKRASAIAHELGHFLGLPHDPGTGDLMDPDRPGATRLNTCISAELVAAAGFTGPGACVQR